MGSERCWGKCCTHESNARSTTSETPLTPELLPVFSIGVEVTPSSLIVIRQSS